MFEIIQEAVLPKLSQSSFYGIFENNTHITNNIKTEISTAKEHIVKPSDIEDIIALMRLNGDAIVKKAIVSYQNGDIIILNNKETSKIPSALPFICIGNGDNVKAYIFADKFVNNIKATNEYTNLMAVLEAAYIAMNLNRKPNTFIMNRPLMLSLCNIYVRMVTTPLEQKLYMKGENLTKAMLYIITYFYRMIDGDTISPSTIPYKRIIADKVDDNVVKQIVDDVKGMENMGFVTLLKLISKINPVRYKDISSTYLSYFSATCGVTLIFAIENISYLMLLLTSSCYRTPVTSFGLNKIVSLPARKTITLLSSVNMN